MTLRDRILITIGALITLTALTIIYIANKAMHNSNISHAYSILTLNNETITSDIRGKISNLKSYAVSITYNKINSLNSPSINANSEDKLGLAKFKFIKSVSISSYDKANFILYPDNAPNNCKINIKYYPSSDVLFTNDEAMTNSVCIYIPITISGKKYLATFDAYLNFFNRSSASLPTLIISPNRFELNLEKFTFVDFKHAKFKSMLDNPEIIKEKSSFFKSSNYFFLIDEIPYTNLRILSYNSIATAQTSYQHFLYSSIGSMFLILIIAIIIFYFVVNSFLKPIKNLCTASKCFADGVYSQKINPSNFREINELISSFNTMVKKIQERESELQKLNANLGKQVEKKTNELLHAAKMASLGTLSSGIAHEFNNILGAVIGHVSLALEKKEPKEMEEALSIALLASERACGIVSRLQDFSRKKSSDHKLFNINDAINNIVKLIEKDLLNFKIQIILDLSDIGAIYVNGDQTEIEQVLLNLLINSKHSMPQGGNITLRTRVENKNLSIKIIDTGYGIPDSIKDRIFEPFFTTKGVIGMGKSFGSQDNEGAGLGLSVSLGIIEAHEGIIRLVSTSKEGTTFEITLPLPE
ncbi:MAG: HAMP domain-containing sensor histidine kinase [Proteobacteria bacterium]|nr:HAMP domain-containing sensor histidine kinase [Pseudomonadota bacterium]